MSASVTDFKLVGLAAGFTLGFGFLTVWNAIKQTAAIEKPYKSPYVILIWIEILSNVTIGVMGWLVLEGVIPAIAPVLSVLLLCWAIEIQCLMQIIINRIYVVVDKKVKARRVKWVTACLITAINIAVFCIWIPAHMDPPVNHTYVLINRYWDPMSKVLICVVDACLNVWFLRVVRVRLIRETGLKKYGPLVRFNVRMMIVSVLMDGLLIGLMFLPNPMVYIQFHPVTYLVKLNIEMTMASLIRKLAKESNINEIHEAVKHLPSRFQAPNLYTKCDDEERDQKGLKHVQFSELQQQGFETEDMKILKTTSVRVVTSPRPFVHDRPSHRR
ncbi:hypothetical protein ETB97_003281 [Aspergillus alliaceus]|uniref:Organic solute transporter Ostalpha-domain-containing protein n=1 Tax=Petromyces alliaceus TaxID=209559 RepID=A0A5N6FYV1_PETAA|nr:uncharacterized protein BDW43DRAFT_319056 [Aspergillus alliaceus]KAB8233954.1 hypothetical protein BDW43DRAFT_319056 [Aspergillus alliaceus]KAE8391085.1 hypothetical protein BDV23DRAFT_193327 [Aspergillus alliaceus]KAF5859140.1 hypothetical protein ETB97_003281 [Aspergillus burnettii]